MADARGELLERLNHAALDLLEAQIPAARVPFDFLAQLDPFQVTLRDGVGETRTIGGFGDNAAARRFAEALGQLVTAALNGNFSPDERQAIDDSLAHGGRLVTAIRLDDTLKVAIALHADDKVRELVRVEAGEQLH